MSKSYPTGGYGYQEPQSDAKSKIDSRKSSFGKLARLIHNGGGWVTSYPGLSYMTFDALPDSTVPQQLRDLDRKKPYIVVDEGEGERILACGITERFTRGATGELEPLVEGSTKPIAETRTHAGITRVKRYTFDF